MSTRNVLSVQLNGEAREVAAGTTLAALVAGLGAAPDRVAVERNGEVVPRRRWAETPLDDGDRLEMVTFVGGG